MGELLNDRYELVSPLGKGGMATVWRANDRQLGREVAVKLLDHRLCGDADSIARLHIEAQALARLNHPHIAAVHDFGTLTGSAFVVMELVQGKPLTEIGGGLPWPAVAGLVSQIADALASAHALGIVHRDVTAANVLLTAQGAKLIDFGICALSGDNDTAHDGRMMGTTAYLAPERLDGEQVGPAVDVYALGILMYLMLTGDLPSRPGPQDIDVPGLPSSIGTICSRCLQQWPWKRPTAEQVSNVLEAFWVPTKEMWKPALDRTALAPPAPLLNFTGPTEVKQLRRQHRSRPPSRRGYALAAAAVVGAFGFVVWQVTNWTPATGPQPQALGPDMQAQAAATVGCRVEYQISDTGDGRFAAAITVTNLDANPIGAGWRLRLNLPGGQRLEPGQEASWQQAGPGVASEPHAEPLAPGQSAYLSLTGTYAEPEGVPADFRLDEGPCEATVVTPSGAPVPASITAGTGGYAQPKPDTGNAGANNNDAGHTGNNGNNGNNGNGHGRGQDRGGGPAKAD